MAGNKTKSISIASMPLTRRGCYIVAVSSMEQIIGAGLSTVIGIMLPMIQLVTQPQMPSALQGFIGATGLIGIAVGSMIIGKLSDRQGYLKWFRICPILIMVGALISYFLTDTPCLIAGLLIAGIGVGGGYSLDSAYISELLPEKWRQIMVGVAKASCSLGFIVVALLCWLILSKDPNPKIWNRLMLIIAASGLLTLLLRINWAESPRWLLSKGKTAMAQAALEKFYGPGVAIAPQPLLPQAKSNVGIAQMFHGENFKRVIFSGIPWACEGLGVYGFGVFLPVLVMALGIESSSVEGMPKIIDSVKVTTLVNFFILPGFIIGLLLMNRLNHVRLLSLGFIGSAVGLGILYAGYVFHMPDLVMIIGFIIFEITLNAGPHLITYIIPSRIYPVEDRGTGTGIAAMIGKVGAVTGVIIMPILLETGGAKLVLIVSFFVMIAGAAISLIYGKALNLINNN